MTDDRTPSTPAPDSLSPAAKDPAEGAREGDAPPAAGADIETSHLGAAGDPAEGARTPG